MKGTLPIFYKTKDQRIVFIVPYHNHTMIGTTDVAFRGSLDDIISNEEIDYLCELVNILLC